MDFAEPPDNDDIQVERSQALTRDKYIGIFSRHTVMFFDLNVPVSSRGYLKKSKESRNAAISYSASELASFENRVDLLIHCGYSVVVFSFS